MGSLLSADKKCKAIKGVVSVPSSWGQTSLDISFSCDVYFPVRMPSACRVQPHPRYGGGCQECEFLWRHLRSSQLSDCEKKSAARALPRLTTERGASAFLVHVALGHRTRMIYLSLPRTTPRLEVQTNLVLELV